MKKYYLKEDVEFERLKDFGFISGCKCINKDEEWERFDKIIDGEYDKNGYQIDISVYIGKHWTKREIVRGIPNILKRKWIKDLIEANLVEEKEV